jgi:hypothetical protein
MGYNREEALKRLQQLERWSILAAIKKLHQKIAPLNYPEMRIHLSAEMLTSCAVDVNAKY